MDPIEVTSENFGTLLVQSAEDAVRVDRLLKMDVVHRLGDDERHERREDVEPVNTGDAE